MAAPSQDARSAGDPAPYPGVWSQCWLVAVLTLIYVLSFVDRGIITQMVNPIKADLGVSDTHMSYILGASFITLYALLSVPAGYFADRVSRKGMIMVGVGFWSAMQMVCGLATSYWQLFLGRVGLGLGEAVLPPSAYSLLRDGVEPRFRSRAYAAYTMAPTLGGGLGALLAGVLFASAAAGAFDATPVLGGLKHWQIVLAAPGLVGLPIALILLTIHEPRRPALPGTAAPTFGDLFRHVGGAKAIYIALLAAATLANAAVNGWTAWLPAAVGRSWDISPATVGRTLGPIQIALAPTTLLVGYLMDRSKARRPDGPLLIACLGCLMNAPFVVAMMLAPSLGAAWMLLALAGLFSATAWVQVACAGLLADVTPGRLMGKATSFFFLAPNLIGVAAGPTLIAWVSDSWFQGPRAIAYAIACCYPALIAGALVALFFTARECRRWRDVTDRAATTSAPARA